MLLVLVALAASLAFPPIQQIRDSLYWAKEIENGTNLYALLNPHHLAYLPTIQALFVEKIQGAIDLQDGSTVGLQEGKG